jgi:hypothetical protein
MAAEALSAASEHDPAHRAAGGSLGASEQLGLGRAATTVLVAHPREDGAQRQLAPRHVRLVEPLHFVATLAFDA